MKKLLLALAFAFGIMGPRPAYAIGYAQLAQPQELVAPRTFTGWLDDQFGIITSGDNFKVLFHNASAAMFHDVKNKDLLGGIVMAVWKPELYHVSIDAALAGSTTTPLGVGPSARIYVGEMLQTIPAYQLAMQDSFLNKGFLKYFTVGGFFIRDFSAGVWREGWWVGPEAKF